MADRRNGRDDQPKSSDDLIREAREALRGGIPSQSEASQELMDDAESWLESAGTSPAAPTERDRRSEEEAEAEIEVLFKPPPRDQRPRRARPPSAPMPPGPIGGSPQAKPRRLILGMAVIVGVVAVIGNIIPIFFAQDAEPVTVSITGSIRSATDPCSGATIGGNLEAVITYWDEDDEPRVEIAVTGDPIWGSDGTAYTLEIAGESVGASGQQVFLFPSDRMTTTRSDGLVIDGAATITVSIADGIPVDWSYTAAESTCPA